MQLNIKRINEWQQLIAEDKLEKVLEELRDWSAETEYSQEITLFQAELKGVRERVNLGTISSSEESLKFNNIRKRLLDLLDKLKTSEVQQSDFLSINLAEDEEEFGWILRTKLPAKYTSLQLIHSGDSANIYRARRSEGTAWEETVAIKAFKTLSLIESENWSMLRSQIGKAVRLARGDGIVGLIDIDMNLPPRYIVMEYMEGMTLDQHIHLGWPYVLWEKQVILREITRTVWRGHMEGMTHGSLRPSKIFMERRLGPTLSPFLAANTTIATRTSGRVREEAIYASPEEMNGHPPGAASDQFSLGLVFYELFKFQPLFHGSEAVDIMRRRIDFLDRPLPEAESLLWEELAETECPSTFVPVIARMLRRRPDERYANLKAVLNELISMKTTQYNREEHHPLQRLEISYERCRRQPDFYEHFFRKLMDSDQRFQQVFADMMAGKRDQLRQNGVPEEHLDERIWRNHYILVDHAFSRLIRYDEQATSLVDERLRQLVAKHIRSLGLQPADLLHFLDLLKESIREHDRDYWADMPGRGPEWQSLDDVWEAVIGQLRDFMLKVAGEVGQS